jgi:hypothetical protein
VAFRARWTREASTQFDSLRLAAEQSLARHSKDKSAKASKAEGLFEQVEKCVRLLLENPRHPGLQTHEYRSIEHPYDARQKVFEAYVQNRTPGAYRLFWCYGPDKNEITLIAITPRSARSARRRSVACATRGHSPQRANPGDHASSAPIERSSVSTSAPLLSSSSVVSMSVCR